MKLRNQLLALFCLLAFIAFGVFFFRTWVIQKPFGIIIFVCDGLTSKQLTAARMYAGTSTNRLALEKFQNVALLTNYSADFAVPDSSAAATALATGEKSDNGSLGIGPAGRRLLSILETAKAQGRAVGVVTNGNLTDAGSAAFYAHLSDGKAAEAVAAKFVDEARLDVALGGGAGLFLPEAKSGKRRDGRDLFAELKQHGVDLIRTKAELEGTSVFRTAPLVGFFAESNLAFSNDPDAVAGQPTLSDLVRRAVQMLQFNQRGYVLVVNAELPTRAAEENAGERSMQELIEFDRAISTALRYAGDKALILATGKHSTGGFSLNGYPLKDDRGVAILGVNPYGYPSISWASGPNGPQPAAISNPASNPASPTGASDSKSGKIEPASFYVPAGVNVAEDMIAVGTGPGSQDLHGFLDNTVIYQIVKKNL